MSGPQLAPLRLARRRCPAPGRLSSRSGRWQSAASCSASPLLAAPDYGRAQQSTAAAEKSAGRRSFVVVQNITDVERLESSSRHKARKRPGPSGVYRDDLNPPPPPGGRRSTGPPGGRGSTDPGCQSATLGALVAFRPPAKKPSRSTVSPGRAAIAAPRYK